MKLPIRSLLLFNLDLSGIFFLLLLWDKGHLLGGWEEEFSEEQNISKTRSGREMETRRALCYGKCDVSMKGLLQYMRNIAKFCGMSRF